MSPHAGNVEIALGRLEPFGSGLPGLLRRWLIEKIPLSLPVRCASLPEEQPAEAAAAPAIDPADGDDLRAALGGDHEAYARLVRRYQQPIGDYLWRFTRDRTEWEELCHEVFVEAWFALAGFAAQAPLLHWLKRIATRAGYRFWRRQQRGRREMPLQASLDAAADEEAISAREAGELVHWLLGRAAPRDRLVLTLVYLESLSVAEVADLTGWTVSMVKVQLHRARKRLARICSERGIEL